jgi:hypothetical protein
MRHKIIRGFVLVPILKSDYSIFRVLTRLCNSPSKSNIEVIVNNNLQGILFLLKHFIQANGYNYYY